MKRNKKECLRCNRLISLSNFDRHISLCKGEKLQFDCIDGRYECPICHKPFTKMGIHTHYWRNHGNGVSHDPNIGYSNGRVAWNKNLTAEDDSRLRKMSVSLSKTVRHKVENGTYKVNRLSPEWREKLSVSQSIRNRGGKCKWFDHLKLDGTIVKVQGTFEKRFAEVLDGVDPGWRRGDTFIWVDEGNRQHRYSADFYSPLLDMNFEVKGYWWGNDKKKMRLVFEQNPDARIEIVREEDLKRYESVET